MNKHNILGKLFKLKIYEADAIKFQDLFFEVFKAKYGTDFHTVKPMGRSGDQKNDGYNSSTNEYYQVYGPEDIKNSIKYAIDKLKVDIPGLIAQWRNAKKVYYVVNDKFKGLGPCEHQMLIQLKDEIEKIASLLSFDVSLFTAHDLSFEFLKLPEEYQEYIVGPVDGYDDEIDEKITLENFHDLFKYILDLPYIDEEEKLYPPNYEKKLEANHFSDDIKARLKIAHLNHDLLEEFYSISEASLEQCIKERIVLAYEEGKCICNEDPDSIYFYILEKICPNKTRIEIQTAECVVSYYFECCDIYISPEEVENETV